MQRYLDTEQMHLSTQTNLPNYSGLQYTAIPLYVLMYSGVSLYRFQATTVDLCCAIGDWYRETAVYVWRHRTFLLVDEGTGLGLAGAHASELHVGRGALEALLDALVHLHAELAVRAAVKVHPVHLQRNVREERQHHQWKERHLFTTEYDLKGATPKSTI